MIGTKIANKKLWWKRPIAVKRAAKTQNNEATTSTQKNIDTDNADINVGNVIFNNLKGKGGGGIKSN